MSDLLVLARGLFLIALTAGAIYVQGRYRRKRLMRELQRKMQQQQQRKT